MTCTIGHAMQQLKREDTMDVRENVLLGGRTYTFVAVFDGHSGKRASEFCAENMFDYIEQAAKVMPSAGGQIRDVVVAVKVCPQARARGPAPRACPYHFICRCAVCA